MEILGVDKIYPFVKAIDKQGGEVNFRPVQYNRGGYTCSQVQRTPMSWSRTIQAWNLQLIFVHGIQINWMDQQNINKDEWDSYRTTCYNPKLKSSNKSLVSYKPPF